jgi:hypothetical protein
MWDERDGRSTSVMKSVPLRERVGQSVNDPIDVGPTLLSPNASTSRATASYE